MIQLTILSNFLRISIPKGMKSQAPNLLRDIWRSEFDQKPDLILDLTKPVEEFIEKAKLNQQILVYL